VGYYSTFVVRIWVGNDAGDFMGRIQHVGTRDSIHFLTSSKMTEFMMQHLSPPSNDIGDHEEGDTPRAIPQDQDILND